MQSRAAAANERGRRALRPLSLSGALRPLSERPWRLPIQWRSCNQRWAGWALTMCDPALRDRRNWLASRMHGVRTDERFSAAVGKRSPGTIYIDGMTTWVYTYVVPCHDS